MTGIPETGGAGAEAAAAAAPRRPQACPSPGRTSREPGWPAGSADATSAGGSPAAGEQAADPDAPADPPTDPGGTLAGSPPESPADQAAPGARPPPDSGTDQAGPEPDPLAHPDTDQASPEAAPLEYPGTDRASPEPGLRPDPGTDQASPGPGRAGEPPTDPAVAGAAIAAQTLVDPVPALAGEPRHIPDGHLLSNRYRLTERIATGGMGEVWRGTDELLGRPVAVKLLSAAHAADEQFRARFRAEARYAGSLSHPGIARVYDYGESAAGLRRRPADDWHRVPGHGAGGGAGAVRDPCPRRPDDGRGHARHRRAGGPGAGRRRTRPGSCTATSSRATC